MEYEDLFGEKSFYDSSKNDLYYQNFLEKK